MVVLRLYGDPYGMYGKSQYLAYGSHPCCDGGHTGLSEDYYWVTPTSAMVTSAAVLTLAVPTAVMASTGIWTAVEAYNVLSPLLIYYAHRKEHLASPKEGCKSVMKWNSGDVKNCECS